jgi:hypothetical protein
MKTTCTFVVAAVAAILFAPIVALAQGGDLRNARLERYFVELAPETVRDWLTFGDLTLRLQCRRVNIDPPVRNAAILVTSATNGFFVAQPGNVPPHHDEQAPGTVVIVQDADIELTGAPVFLVPQRGTQSNAIRGTAGEVILIEGFIGNDLSGADAGCTFVGTLVRFMQR